MHKKALVLSVSVGMLAMGAVYAVTHKAVNKNTATATTSTTTAPANSDASEDTSNSDTGGNDVDSDTSENALEDY